MTCADGGKTDGIKSPWKPLSHPRCFMRLNGYERKVINSAVKEVDPTAHVYLFGSRTDDAKRGGDIDLLVVSTRIGRREKRLIRRRVCDAIGEQKIDIVVEPDFSKPFTRLAVERGVSV